MYINISYIIHIYIYTVYLLPKPQPSYISPIPFLDPRPPKTTQPSFTSKKIGLNSQHPPAAPHQDAYVPVSPSFPMALKDLQRAAPSRCRPQKGSGKNGIRRNPTCRFVESNLQICRIQPADLFLCFRSYIQVGSDNPPHRSFHHLEVGFFDPVIQTILSKPPSFVTSLGQVFRPLEPWPSRITPLTVS